MISAEKIGEPQHARLRRIVFTVAFAALLVKMVLAARTYGTNDVYTWTRFQELSRVYGVELYRLSWGMNHPPFMIHVLRLLGWLARTTHTPFPYWMRLPAILADFASVGVVWKLLEHRLGERTTATALVMMAAAPASILISGFHGNTDPLMTFLVLLAVWMAERELPERAGLACGLALSIKVVPVVLLPAFFFYISGWRRKLMFAGTLILTIAIAWAPFIYQDPITVFHKCFGYASLYGNWGISRILTIWSPVYKGLYVPSLLFYRYGKYLLGAILLGLAAIMNRQTPKVPLYSQLGLLFFVLLAISSGFGVQYLAWLMPWAVDLGAAPAALLYVTSGVFLLLVYNLWCQGIPWYYAGSINIGGFEGWLDYFAFLCWIAVIAAAVFAGWRIQTGRPIQLPKAKAVILAAVMAGLLSAGFYVDREALPVSSRDVPLPWFPSTLPEYLRDLAAEDVWQQDYNAAIYSAQEALRLGPDVPAAWDTLAAAHVNLGRWDLARQDLDHALQLDPDDRDAQSLANQIFPGSQQ